jgi:hypothetical protein
LPPPIAEIVDVFSGTEAPKQTQPKVRRPSAKKANTPSPSDAESEQQLYQEFLEWRKRQKDKQ